MLADVSLVQSRVFHSDNARGLACQRIVIPFLECALDCMSKTAEDRDTIFPCLLTYSVLMYRCSATWTRLRQTQESLQTMTAKAVRERRDHPQKKQDILILSCQVDLEEIQRTWETLLEAARFDDTDKLFLASGLVSAASDHCQSAEVSKSESFRRMGCINPKFSRTCDTVSRSQDKCPMRTVSFPYRP